MYALGLTTRQIQDHLKEIYAVDVSPELISRATDAVKELAAAWRGRPLEPLYPVLFLDALRVNIREGPTVVKKSVYLALAIRLDGQKELLGLWIEQNEGAIEPLVRVLDGHPERAQKPGSPRHTAGSR
jgi:transposase-like protein